MLSHWNSYNSLEAIYCYNEGIEITPINSVERDSKEKADTALQRQNAVTAQLDKIKL